MSAEYDFSKGKPNPYAQRFRGDITIVVLDVDDRDTGGTRTKAPTK